MAVTLINATLASLAPPRVFQAALSVDGGAITALGAPPGDGDEVIDCAGRLVMPGNVCSHTHLYSALARGMPGPPRTPTNFPEILELIWWRLDRALDEPGIRQSGLLAALDAVKSGTTTLVDHHASPECIDGSLDVLADALQQVGVRGVLCYEVTDRGGRERRDAGLRENERFLQENGRETVRGMIGAHASFTLEDETLEALADMATRRRSAVHVHVAEDVCDEDDALRRCGRRAAIRLSEAGLLSDRSIAAHGVHLDQAELNTLRGRGTWLVHNCRSNMNNAVGRAPLAAFGERAALGTDGIDGDMFAESRTAFFRRKEEDLSADAARFTALLAAGGELVSPHFGLPVGSLDVGAAADLVVLDYEPPTPLDATNLPWHWMFAMHAGLVQSVMVAGRWVVRNGECVTVDEERIRSEARREARRLWQRMEAL